MKRRSRPVIKRKPLRRRVKRLLWLLIPILIAWFFLDVFVIEVKYPALSVYHVEVPNLPENLDGFKIVQLSDVHRLDESFDPVIRRAVEIANSQKPDIAVLTGDFAGQDISNYDPCMKLLAEINTKKGIYAVLGNHDHWAGANSVKKAIRENDIRLLDNSNKEVAPGLFIAGVDDHWTGRPNGRKALRGVGRNDCCVMASHSPHSVKEFAGRKGLFICGHTHGGQVQIPFIPRNRLPGLRGSEYIDGWYNRGGILVYVSRGVGVIDPAVRFRCRSEVVLYVLHPGETARVE